MYEITVTRKEKSNTYKNVVEYDYIDTTHPALFYMFFQLPKSEKRIYIPLTQDVVDIEIEGNE